MDEQVVPFQRNWWLFADGPGVRRALREQIVDSESSPSDGEQPESIKREHKEEKKSVVKSQTGRPQRLSAVTGQALRRAAKEDTDDSEDSPKIDTSTKNRPKKARVTKQDIDVQMIDTRDRKSVDSDDTESEGNEDMSSDDDND